MHPKSKCKCLCYIMLTYRNSTAQQPLWTCYSFVSIGTSAWTTSLSCLLMSSETCPIWKNCEDDFFCCCFFLLHYFPLALFFYFLCLTLFASTVMEKDDKWNTSMMIWNDLLHSPYFWVWPYLVIFCIFLDLEMFIELLKQLNTHGIH